MRASLERDAFGASRVPDAVVVWWVVLLRAALRARCRRGARAARCRRTGTAETRSLLLAAGAMVRCLDRPQDRSVRQAGDQRRVTPQRFGQWCRIAQRRTTFCAASRASAHRSTTCSAPQCGHAGMGSVAISSCMCAPPACAGSGSECCVGTLHSSNPQRRAAAHTHSLKSRSGFRPSAGDVLPARSHSTP
jgi:hypothetical protein